MPETVYVPSTHVMIENRTECPLKFTVMDAVNNNQKERIVGPWKTELVEHRGVLTIIVETL